MLVPVLHKHFILHNLKSNDIEFPNQLIVIFVKATTVMGWLHSNRLLLTPSPNHYLTIFGNYQDTCTSTETNSIDSSKGMYLQY